MEQTQQNRWIEISQTSPSGKMMFSCRSCGRVSVTPDKDCPKGIDVYYSGTIFKMPCSLWPMNQSEWVEMEMARKIENKEAYFTGVIYFPDGPLHVSAPINEDLAKQLGCHSVEYQMREAARKSDPQANRKTRNNVLERLKEKTAENLRRGEVEAQLRKLQAEAENAEAEAPPKLTINELYRLGQNK